MLVLHATRVGPAEGATRPHARILSRPFRRSVFPRDCDPPHIECAACDIAVYHRKRQAGMAPLPSFPRSTGQPLVEAFTLVGLRIAENPLEDGKTRPCRPCRAKTRGGAGGGGPGAGKDTRGVEKACRFTGPITQKKKWKNPNECISV